MSSQLGVPSGALLVTWVIRLTLLCAGTVAPVPSRRTLGWDVASPPPPSFVGAPCPRPPPPPPPPLPILAPHGAFTHRSRPDRRGRDRPTVLQPPPTTIQRTSSAIRSRTLIGWFRS